MVDYETLARGGGGAGGGSGGGGGAGEAMMMMVMADDRAPGLLPPRKRLLAGLKHNRTPPASSLPPPPAPTFVTDQAMADPGFLSASRGLIQGFYQQCSSCGLADPRLLLHRLGSPSRLLCSSCVLSFHKHMYCYICLQVFTNFGLQPAESSAFLTCRKCQRLCHLQCARERWPFAFDFSDSGTTLCINCSKPGGVSFSLGTPENLLFAGNDHREVMEPSSKRQRIGRVCTDDILALSRARSKWMSCDLIQQASQELPLVDQEALAAAKVVATIAEKGARDAKMRARTAAAIAAQAAARAKLALDNAFRAGQDEANAQSLAEELLLVEASSDPPEGETMMQQQAAMNVELTRQRSPISVPRNSRSSAPVHKRRTLSAIVASEESRAQANLLANPAASLSVMKQQTRRPRSDALRRAVGVPDAAKAQASFSQSSVAGLELPLPVTFTPCSSHSGTTQVPGSAARLEGVCSSSPPSLVAKFSQGGAGVCGSTVVSPVLHHANNALQCPASVPPVVSSENYPTLLPSIETPSKEVRHETSGFVAGAQDLNLPAEGLSTLSENSHLVESLMSPPVLLSRDGRLQDTDTSSRLETTGTVPDDEREKKTSENHIAHASPDVTFIALKPSAGSPLQNRNSENYTAAGSNAGNGEFDEACVEASCFQPGQSTDANVGHLEIVLPGIEAVERESPEGCVETSGAYYGQEATLMQGHGFTTCSDERAVRGASASDSALIYKNEISLGAEKAKVYNQFVESTCMTNTQEQGKIRGLAGVAINEIISIPRSQLQGSQHFRMSSCDDGSDPASISKRSVVSSCSVPLQGITIAGSPMEIARNF